jgi:hypothetical protein
MAAQPQTFQQGSRNISQALLPEFDQEMANTRKSLERVPEDKFSFKPHTKSMTMGALATHLATINHWAEAIFGQDSFDVKTAPPTRNSRRGLKCWRPSIRPRPPHARQLQIPPTLTS